MFFVKIPSCSECHRQIRSEAELYVIQRQYLGKKPVEVGKYAFSAQESASGQNNWDIDDISAFPRFLGQAPSLQQEFRPLIRFSGSTAALRPNGREMNCTQKLDSFFRFDAHVIAAVSARVYDTFQNLNFESANVPPLWARLCRTFVPIASALPDWTNRQRQRANSASCFWPLRPLRTATCFPFWADLEWF